MPYDRTRETKPCTVCGSDANLLQENWGVGEVVNCVRCGDFQISHVTADAVSGGLPLSDPKQRALASHLIRRMQVDGGRPKVTPEFFNALPHRRLPTPTEAGENLIRYFAKKADYRPGQVVTIDYTDPAVRAVIGAVDPSDTIWTIDSLVDRKILKRVSSGQKSFDGNLTAEGWKRFEELERAHVASRYAFFARKFANPDLDRVVEECLRQAIEQTGFELRVVTQRAGLVDAIIEDEIRRCKFLISDLSDDNAGAYWEAGFAEGLGKPVIYICKEKEVDGVSEKKTHFDTNHRHTIRWSLSSLDATAKNLKAVIRNTLLGDAKQSD